METEILLFQKHQMLDVCQTSSDRSSFQVTADKSTSKGKSGYHRREKLGDMDNSAFPYPLTRDQLSKIIHQIHSEIKEENVVCSVCDEICLLSRTKVLEIKSLPLSFFSELRTPAKVSDGTPLLPKELAGQYDISAFFPSDDRFKELLLSPRGVKRSQCNCVEKNQDCCTPLLNICLDPGCYQALSRGTIPKYAIAQGNWIGQLPEELRNMTYGSRSLIRPMHSFGCLAAYKNGGGMRLTGHVYSNKLNTPLVRSKLPLNPSDVPVRVLVVSPLATDASAFSRAKMASLKEDYIIEPEKIKGALDFFKQVGNKTMESIEFDENEFMQLPNCEVSVNMFHSEHGEILQRNEKNDNNLIDGNTNKLTGGPSLLRTNAEAEEGILVSTTVTVGAIVESDDNIHEEVVRALTENNETSTGNS